MNLEEEDEEARRLLELLGEGYFCTKCGTWSSRKDKVALLDLLRICHACLQDLIEKAQEKLSKLK